MIETRTFIFWLVFVALVSATFAIGIDRSRHPFVKRTVTVVKYERAPGYHFGP